MLAPPCRIVHDMKWVKALGGLGHNKALFETNRRSGSRAPSMPTLFRFLMVLGVITGVVAGSLYVLAEYFQPEPKEISKALRNVKARIEEETASTPSPETTGTAAPAPAAAPAPVAAPAQAPSAASGPGAARASAPVDSASQGQGRAQ